MRRKHPYFFLKLSNPDMFRRIVMKLHSRWKICFVLLDEMHWFSVNGIFVYFLWIIHCFLNYCLQKDLKKICLVIFTCCSGIVVRETCEGGLGRGSLNTDDRDQCKECVYLYINNLSNSFLLWVCVWVCVLVYLKAAHFILFNQKCRRIPIMGFLVMINIAVDRHCTLQLHCMFDAWQS